MAMSYDRYTADGATPTFTVTFNYLDRSHVTVLVNEVSVTFTWDSDTVVRPDALPANGDDVRIVRTTPQGGDGQRAVDFQNGSTLPEVDLDNSARQNMMIAEEARDEADRAFKLPIGHTQSVEVPAPTAAGQQLISNGDNTGFTFGSPSSTPVGISPGDGTKLVRINAAETSLEGVDDADVVDEAIEFSGNLTVSGNPSFTGSPSLSGTLNVTATGDVVETGTANSLLMPTGVELDWAGESTDTPAGWLLMYGQAVAANTYPNLFALLVKSQGNTDRPLPAGGTVFTVDTATDELIAAAHGKVNGDLIHVAVSGGSLAGGLTAKTRLYVVGATTDRFQVSLTLGGAAIDITTAGSGTQSFYDQFTIPDRRGVVVAGLDNMGGVSADRVTDTEADTVGGRVGAETHTLVESELPGHTHGAGTLVTDSSGDHDHKPLDQTNFGTSNNGAYDIAGTSTFGDIDPKTSPAGNHSHTLTGATASTGGGTTHNNLQPTVFLNRIIKT